MTAKETLDKIAEIVAEHKQQEVDTLREKMKSAQREGIGLAQKHQVTLPHEVFDFLYGLPNG